MMTDLLRAHRIAGFSRRAAVLLLAAVSGAVGTAAKADTLNGGVLIPWNPNVLYGTPNYIPGLYYWNNNSGDGNQANIGWCLIGGVQCGMQNPPGRIPFYTAPSGSSAPADMYFSSAGQTLQLTLDATVTNQKNGGSGADFFGYYLTDSSGMQISNPVILFNSSQALGSTLLLSGLSSGQNYAFFIDNIQGYGTNAPQTTYSFYMNPAANASSGAMPADSMQHFAVFQNGSTFYLGTVDGDACAGMYNVNNSPCILASVFDYNDMVVQISPVAPEPASAGLFALGIAVAGVLARRRIAGNLR